MIRPTLDGGNNTSAIGRPDARLFFDPQNSSTIASPRSSRANRSGDHSQERVQLVQLPAQPDDDASRRAA